MALTKITPQMFDTSATAHDLNVDNGTFVVDGSASRVGIGTATPSTLLDVNGIATATTFVGALTGNVTGTILTAAQTNITSLGTLSALTVTGALTGSDILLVDSGTTERSIRIQNSAATAYFGVEGPSANRFVGSAANNMFLGTTTADGIQFATNNNVRAVIDSSGNVGIGTSSPTQKLDVRGGTGAGAITHAIFTGTSSRGLEIRTRSDTSGGQNSGTAEINSADSEGTGGDLAFSSNGNVRMFIDGGGNVGIGNTGPTNKLSIGQNLGTGFAITAASGTPYGMVLQTDEGTPSANPNFWVRTNDGNAVSTLFRIQNNGLVGIGTTNPLNPLHIKQSGGSHLFALETTYATDRSGRGQISWRDSANITGGIWTEYDGTNVSMRFGNLYSSGYNTNTSMIIRGNGNVGIGTASPAARLSVPNGGFSFDSTTGIPAIRAEGSYGGAIGLLDTKEAGWYAMNNGDTLHQYVGRTPGSNAPNANIVMTYLSSGKVGIGTTSAPAGLPLQTKVSSGDNKLRMTTANKDAFILELKDATGDVHLGTNTTAGALVIEDDGDVYVGGNFAVNSAPISGTQVYIKRLDGNTNLMRWGEGSGQNQYRFRIDQNFQFIANSGSGDNITLNSTNGHITAVQYNTPSDERLKENIAYADDAGSKIDSIQVRKFNWIADGSHQDYGMVAQELNEIAPEAVSASEDLDEMMGVDYSKLVPMLIKEIQSLRTRVAQLEEDK